MPRSRALLVVAAVLMLLVTAVACGGRPASTASPTSAASSSAAPTADETSDGTSSAGPTADRPTGSSSAATSARPSGSTSGGTQGSSQPAGRGNPSSSSSSTTRTTTSAGPGFDDEFSGSTVDTTRWVVNVTTKPPPQSNNEEQCYQPANVAEGGGFLTQQAKVDTSCAGYSYTSGAIQTRYTFTYGTVDVRAKFAGGTGTWPTIWLLGAKCQPWRMGSGCNPPWPQPGSDEIDIAETLNSNHTAVNEQIHASAGSPGCMPSTSDTSQNWHEYTLVWAPGSLTWKIDGQTRCTQTGAAVPSRPMFLILNTAVGGTGGGTVNNGTLPQTSWFDYARITP